MAKFDFSGWATRNDLQCADGRIIRKNAFKQQDGETVSLVWNHQHDSQNNVLGHALLKNRDDGVYAYCTFNDTESGQTAKKLVQHGDVVSLSIAANQLKQMGKDVVHGIISEVSLVLAGANPGAYIDTVMNHGVAVEDELIINYNENIMLYHSDDETENKDKKPDDTGESKDKKPNDKSSEDDETVGEVFDRICKKLDEKEQNVMLAMVGMALGENGEPEDNNDDSKGGNEDMKHNVFDNKGETQENVLSHAAQSEILELAKSSSVGSLQAAIKIYNEKHGLQHADISGFIQTGNGNITTMFPEYVEAHPSRTPELITNDMGWVDAIMAKTQKIPHGRVRTSHVDIRNIDALAAKGYQKGNEKKITGNYELVRRTTDPQTVYVTSELHRDDVVDIEDFDYVQFQYSIDQISLKETLAVATMLGDERPNSDPEKIFPDKIRPIRTDDELYTIHKDVDFAAMAKELQGANTEQYFGESFIYAEAMVTALRKARKDFRGTGKPDLFITTDMHNTMILARDRNGRRIYETDTELAAALGVANIYEVTQFEGKVRTDSDGVKHKLHAICVNMADYGYGASKGGDVTHFTDFDIKFNQLQSLLETRKSGQLTRIKSAIVIEEKETNVSVSG
jgi:phage head maturation protease